MKRLFQLRYWLAAALMVGGLAACDENEESDWKTGAPVKAGCQQVHFVGNNSTKLVMDSSDPAERTDTLTLVRNTDKGALTVSLEAIKVDEGVTVPTQAEFAEGSTTTKVEVTASEQAPGTLLAYELKIVGDEVDPYTKSEEGTPVFGGAISFPKERRAKAWFADVNNEGSKYAAMGVWEETILEIGKDSYYIGDLMGTGNDLWLKYDENADKLTLDSKSPNFVVVNPASDWEWGSDYAGIRVLWWGDDNTSDIFYPHGKSAYINVDEFQIYEADGYTGYWKDYQWFYIDCYSLKYNSWKRGDSYSAYLYIRLIADDDPFEPYLPEQPQEPEEPDEPQGDPIATHRAVFYFPDYENEMGKWEESVLEYQNGWYKIEDWMESGVDLMFKADPSTNDLTLNSSSAAFVVDGMYKNWGYTDFYPHGNSFTSISYISMYEAPSYSAYDPDDDLYYINCNYVQFSTWDQDRFDEWKYLYFYFIADDDPFTPIIPDPQNPNPDPDPDPVDVTATVTYDHFGYYDSNNNWQDLNMFGNSQQVTLKKIGETKYVFEDFLNSGTNVTITIKNEDGDIELTDSDDYTYYYQGYWYLTDSNGDYIPYYPDLNDQNHYVNSMYVYGTRVYGENWYTYYYNGTFTLYSYIKVDTDYTTEYTGYINIKINE